MRPSFTRFITPVLLLAAVSVPASGQSVPSHAKADTTASVAIVQSADSITLNPKLNLRSKRALVKLRATAAALAANAGTAYRVDTVFVTKPDTTPKPPLTATISIHGPGGDSVVVGTSLQLVAVPKDAQGNTTTAAVRWGASPTAVCDISGTGLLTGKAAGTCTTTATADTASNARAWRIVAAAQPPPIDTTKPPTDTTTPPAPPVISGYPVPPSLGGNTAMIAALPRDTVDARYPATTRTVKVAAGANLQTAINAAVPGDVLALAPGSVFTGDFSLPKHAGAGVATCSGWVVIRTDIADSLLGPEGRRMTPTRAASLRLARIQNTDNQQAIGTALGVPNVGCWRLDGLEIATGPAGFDVNGLVRLGDYNANDSTKQAHHLVVARSFVHGVPIPAGITSNQQQGWPGSIRRCFAFYSRYNAVVDSWAEQCRGGNGDSQTILGYPGTGPYLVRNNHLSGGTEVVMIGGATGPIIGAVPSDWTIHGNHITRELADTLTLVKNLFEIKNAARVDFAGNITRLNWPNGQVGFGWLVKSVNQSSGSCTWCHAIDITIRYSMLTMSGSGANFAGIQEAPAQPAARYTVYRNLIDTLGFRTTVDNTRPLQVLGNGSTLSDLILAYNTIGAHVVSTNGIVPWGLMSVSGDAPRVVIQSNVMWCGGYGIKGDGTGTGTITLDTFFKPWEWSGNELFGCVGGYPPSTTYTPSYPNTGGGAVLGTLLNGVIVPR